MSEDLDPKTHTEYSGKVGHEKKLHKTHFQMLGKKLKSQKDWPYEWVEIGVGRYVRVRKEKTKC